MLKFLYFNDERNYCFVWSILIFINFHDFSSLFWRVTRQVFFLVILRLIATFNSCRFFRSEKNDCVEFIRILFSSCLAANDVNEFCSKSMRRMSIVVLLMGCDVEEQESFFAETSHSFPSFVKDVNGLNCRSRRSMHFSLTYRSFFSLSFSFFSSRPVRRGRDTTIHRHPLKKTQAFGDDGWETWELFELLLSRGRIFRKLLWQAQPAASSRYWVRQWHDTLQ